MKTKREREKLTRSKIIQVGKRTKPHPVLHVFSNLVFVGYVIYQKRGPKKYL
jgi:hypothetical protein